MSWYKEHKDEWKQIIEAISNDTNRNAFMIEKDTIQSMFLYRLSNKIPSIVFKGGTSLSKVYKLIDRFSEDIDLSYPGKITEGEKRNVYNVVREIANELGLTLSNPDDVKSRYSYNKYVYKYESLFSPMPLEIIVETNFYLPVYPVIKKEVSSMVNDYVINNKLTMPIPFIEGSFSMNVQSLERTFIDKVFAVCDYKLQNMEDRDSRHLYDIAKMMPCINIDNEFNSLFRKVRLDRATSKNNPSAQPEYDIKAILQNVIDTRFYEPDYRNITSKLLYDKMSYDEAIKKGIRSFLLAIK